MMNLVMLMVVLMMVVLAIEEGKKITPIFNETEDKKEEVAIEKEVTFTRAEEIAFDAIFDLYLEYRDRMTEQERYAIKMAYRRSEQDAQEAMINPLSRLGVFKSYHEIVFAF